VEPEGAVGSLSESSKRGMGERIGERLMRTVRSNFPRLGVPLHLLGA
jgi:hypothetical protein